MASTNVIFEVAEERNNIEVVVEFFQTQWGLG